MIYRLPNCRLDARALAERLDAEPSAEAVLFARATTSWRGAKEKRSSYSRPAAVRLPRRRGRAWAALHNPNAGEVIVSAAPGVEFADLAGRHHAGGGSHGSLRLGDSECRCSRSGSTPSRSRSSTSRRRSSATSASSLLHMRERSRVPPDRHQMIEQQLRLRDVADERVLAAMERVPRELFVPEELRDRAYDDAALPIGGGQTISQPYMVAKICEALSLHGGEHVLDVGSGSGYQAAVLAELAAEVDTIERIPELAELARANLVSAGYERVRVHVGDGTRGLPERAPFDAIAVAAAAPRMPQTLYEQLEPRGRLVVPVGRFGIQRLEVIVRSPEGPAVVKSVPCRFVPLVGEEGF
jgi:protein-L-isoaspartate(D-aspartate) O-methyltransferase